METKTGDLPPPYPTGEQPPAAMNPGYAAPPAPYPAAAPYPTQPQYPQAGQPMPVMQPQQPGMASGQTVVVTQPTVLVTNNRLGPNPATTTCTYCQAHITTNIQRSCGGFVWMIAGIICLIGLFTMGITWLGCCLIPFCIPSLYDTEHTCPNCNRLISTHTHF